jgi:hypothetical protein
VQKVLAKSRGVRGAGKATLTQKGARDNLVANLIEKNRAPIHILADLMNKSYEFALEAHQKENKSMFREWGSDAARYAAALSPYLHPRIESVAADSEEIASATASLLAVLRQFAASAQVLEPVSVVPAYDVIDHDVNVSLAPNPRQSGSGGHLLD